VARIRQHRLNPFKRALVAFRAHDRAVSVQADSAGAGQEAEVRTVRPATPIRAIGIAGDDIRIAPTLFGVQEIAWSSHPDRSFHPDRDQAS
jgi:hypothetical protein